MGIKANPAVIATTMGVYQMAKRLTYVSRGDCCEVACSGRQWAS